MTRDALRRAILEKVKGYKSDMIADLQRLVRIPSVVGTEGPFQQVMAEWYRQEQLAVTVVPVDFASVSAHPEYCGWQETAEAYAGRPNVVGAQKGAGGGRSLILNGHCDVVSPEPIAEWTVPPWEGIVRDGRMYGRGAYDMKGGLVSNVYALRTIKALGLRPKGDVILQSTIEEEAGGGGGALALLAAGFTADAFIAAEPTGFSIRIGNGGIRYFRVRVQGKTAHAGNAHLGINAIGKMLPIYQALVALDAKRATQENPLFAAGSLGRSCHLSLGTMQAGDWPSTVAGWAVLQGRVGFLPGETGREVEAQIRDTISRAVAGDPWLAEHPPEVEFFGWKAEPWLEPTDQPFLQTMQTACTEMLGRPVDFSARTSGVDSRFPHYFGFPGVCFGAAGANAHGADEWADLDSLVGSTSAVVQTILDWCGYVD